MAIASHFAGHCNLEIVLLLLFARCTLNWFIGQSHHAFRYAYHFKWQLQLQMPIYRKIKSKQTKILALRFYFCFILSIFQCVFSFHSFTISTRFFQFILSLFQRQPSIFTEDGRFVEFFLLFAKNQANPLTTKESIKNS